MDYIAIDIGSGLCKFCRNKKRHVFPSVVGKYKQTNSFKFGIEDHQIIVHNNEQWMTGAAAQNYIETQNKETSTKATWSETKGHLILLYSAIAYLFPEGFDGELPIVTGLPIKKYEKEYENYKNKILGTHEFKTTKSTYKITFVKEKTYVLPQVVGLHFSNIYKNNKENWNEIKIGYVDPGTLSTGWSVIDDGVFNNVLSDGENVGLIKLAQEIQNYLKAKYDWAAKDINQILKALTKGYLEIYQQGKLIKIDLIDVAQQFVPQVYKKVFDGIHDCWGNANDMRVIISSGGAMYIIDTLKKHIPHSTIMTKAKKTDKLEHLFDVVEGYSVYCENKLAG
jgi:hypothetical protein